MTHLSEALSKSMIKKIKPHIKVLTDFTINDLENGDIVIKSVPEYVWMFLTNEEIQKRINEFWQLTDSNTDKIFNKKSDAFVTLSETYNLYRMFLIDCKNYNGHIRYNLGANPELIKLIKCNGEFLDPKMSIRQIFEKYKLEKMQNIK